MIPSSEQLALLNRLLAILANDHVAALDDAHLPTGVVVTYQFGPNRILSHLSIDPSEEEGSELWTVNAAVQVPGNRETPDDVDVCEVAPPSPWDVACSTLVQLLVKHAIQDSLDGLSMDELARDMDMDFGASDYEDPNSSMYDVDARNAVDRDAADWAFDAETHGDES